MSLFEAVEFSSLQLDSKGLPPTLLCTRDSVCVLDEGQIHMVKQTNESICLSASIELENDVSAAGISEDGSFVAAGDSVGTLHFISVSLELIFHTQQMFDPDVDESKFKYICFTSVDNGCCKLLVLFSSGILSIFNNFLITRLDQGLVSGDLSCVKEVRNAMTLNQVDLTRFHSSEVTSIVSPVPDTFITSGVGSSSLGVWYVDSDNNDDMEVIPVDGVDKLFNGAVISKCCVTTNSCILVALTDAGGLSVWLLDLLVMVNRLFNKHVSQFGLVARDNQQQDLLCCILDNQTLELYSLPKLNSLYSVSFSSCVVLPHSGFIYEDGLYFAVYDQQDVTEGPAGGLGYHDDDKAILSNISIKQLVQRRPEDKLAKLLASHKFEEAFRFAVKYDLSLELVHKKKAEVINVNLCQKDLQDSQATNIVTLINTLNEITDHDFTCNMVLSSSYQSYTTLRDLLYYAKDKAHGGNTEELAMKVNSALNRLITYKALYGEEYSPISWKNFMEGNLLSEFCNYIRMGSVSLATIIWNRHEVELLLDINFNDDCLVSILNSVPESVSSSDIGVWLRNDILPCVMCHCPGVVEHLVSWLMAKVMSLEITEKGDWPLNGLKLLETVLSCLISNGKWDEQLGISANQCNSQLKMITSPCINVLQDHYNQLQNLSYVKQQLGFILPLSEYLNETHETVVFKLLDKTVATETIASIIDSKISPYVGQFSLSLDTVLVHYIKYMLTRIPKLMPDSPWEAKGVVVVQSIKDRKLYVEGCIELLRGIRTYWSASVESLVQDCLQVDHSCVEELKKEYKLLILKRLLFEYGITNFNYSYSNVDEAWRYIRYILKQKSNSVLKDALEIAELYSLKTDRVYMFHLAELGANEEVWKIPEVLMELEYDKGINVATRTITYMLAKLDSGFNEKIDTVFNWKVDMSVCMECVKHLQLQKAKAVMDDSAEELLSVLRKLLVLQDQFDTILTRHTLRNQPTCDKLINSCLAGVISAPNDKLIESGRRYMKFGSLLGYSATYLCFRLARALLRNNRLKDAQVIISFLNPDLLLTDKDRREYVEGLVDMVMGIWWALEREKEDIERWIVDWMVSMAAAVVQRSPTDMLLYSTELYSLCCLLKWVWSTCIGDIDVDNRFTSVLDINRYKEDGLLLELSRVIPTTLQYCRRHLSGIAMRRSHDSHVTRRIAGPASVNDPEPLDTLIDFLEENGHHQIALSLGIKALMHHLFISSLRNADESIPLPIKMDTLLSIQYTLTTKVLTARKVDHWYGVALLLLAPPNKSNAMITDCRGPVSSSYTKVKEFCKVAIDYGTVTGQLEIVKGSQFFYKTADWGKRLRDYQISFTKAFRGGNPEKEAIMIKMFHNPEISLDMILEYCSHIGCKDDEAYFRYVRILLTTWMDNYKDRLSNVIELINNKEKLLVLLYQILTRSVSPYDYQRIEVILNHLEVFKADKAYKPNQQLTELMTRGRKLLECLKRHIRCGTISTTENNWIEKWKAINKTATHLHFDKQPVCLPFHLLLFESSSSSSVAVTILSSEITSDSLSKLIPICSILQISSDTLLEEAISSIINKGSENLMYSHVSPLVAYITNHQKAITAAKWVASEIGKSNMAESIKGLKAAVDIAEKWKSNCNDQDMKKVEAYCSDCMKYLQIAQTELVLQVHNLQQDEFTSLVSRPTELIRALYRDCTTSRPQVIPVHEIVTNIGSIYGVDMKRIRIALAEEWLPFFKAASRDMDITQLSMLEDPTAAPGQLLGNKDEEMEESEEELSLRRLSYLLNIPNEINETVQFLLKWIKTPKIMGGARSRIRAAQVLFAIAPVSTIESVSGETIGEITELTQVVLFLSELEDIRMKMNVDGFRRCKKEGLIWTLWRNHSHEPRAVRLVCELCIYYNIHDHKLWSKVLEQLLELHMVQYLHHILKRLSQLPIIHKISNIKQIWYDTVLSPFKEASCPLTPYQQRECTKSIKLLKQCPFVHDMDISTLVKSFDAVGIPSTEYSSLIA